MPSNFLINSSFMAKLARLICCEREFEVPEGLLTELELFNEDYSLLERPYSVSSNVSLRVFETFVDALTRKEVDVTLGNYAGLALLSKEFGFHRLDRDIEVHRSRNAEETTADLMRRFSDIERTFECMRLEWRDLQSLEPRVNALEGRAASIPDVVTAQIMAERNERLANVRDLHEAVHAQCIKRDDVVAKLDQLAEQISDECKSRQSDIQDLKARLEQPQDPSVPTQTPKVTSGVRREFKLAGDKFNGIIAHLTRMCGGHVGDKGLIDATASSIKEYDRWGSHQPGFALDMCDDTFYQSINESDANPWICLDFKSRRVSVTQYSICLVSIKSWVLEGSLDGNSWDELDKRNDHETVAAQGTKLPEVSFSIFRHDEYRFIRFRQTGKNSYGFGFLILPKIELFGTITD